MASKIMKAAALIAAQRKQVDGECAVCGKPFTATTRRMYCSNACKLKAARSRRAPASRDAEG